MKKLLAVLFVLVLAVGIAACDSGDSEDDNGDAVNSEQPTDMCGGLCVDGQYCFNGLCVNGCLSGNDCASDQYCLDDEFAIHGKCVPKVPQGCTSDGDCAVTQECKKGACLAPVPAAEQPDADCKWQSDMTDGCEATHLCVEKYDDSMENVISSECSGVPACGDDGTCPVDLGGGVCNLKADGTKVVPTKSAICLMGMCLGADDCPSGMECLNPLGGLGACIPKMDIPAGCESDDDCDGGLVCNTMIGQCVPDMF